MVRRNLKVTTKAAYIKMANGLFGMRMVRRNLKEIMELVMNTDISSTRHQLKMENGLRGMRTVRKSQKVITTIVGKIVI